MYSYTIEYKKNLKHLYIKVNKDLSITVRAPNKYPKILIKALVLTKKNWIDNRRIYIKNLDEKKIIKDGYEIYYFGEKYYLKIINNNDKEKPRIILENNLFYLYCSQNNSHEEIQNTIKKFYISHAQKILPEIVKKSSERTNLKAEKIIIKALKSKWGSCNTKNEITLNAYLIKCSHEIIEYIVIHELSHIKIKNHSKNFWDLVENLLPNSKLIRKKLRLFEKKLYA